MKKEDRAKLKPGNWVRVLWHDISDDSAEGWVDPSEVKNTICPITTTGYVVRVTRRELVLAMSHGIDYSGTVEVGNTSAIPLGTIERVEEWPNGG